VCLAAALLMAGCSGKSLGRGASRSWLSTIAHTDEPTVTIVNSSAPESANGLRQQIEFRYDTASYPAVDGFTIVPMAEGTEALPGTGGLTLATRSEGAKKVLSITASNAEKVRFHVRYDAAAWSVDQVKRFNAFGTGRQFISLATVVEPGLLLIRSIPVDQPASLRANGLVAEITMSPGGRTASNSAVTGDSGYGILWHLGIHQHSDHSLYPVRSLGTYHQRLDGVTSGSDGSGFGFLGAKDGTLDSTEAGLTCTDAQLQDAVLLDTSDLEHPAAYAMQTYDATDWQPFTLRWTERLPGDYDNNGEVNDNDITPIGMMMTNNPPVVVSGKWYGQEAAKDAATGSEDNLKANIDPQFSYTDPPPDELHFPWTFFSHDINGFYYFDSLNDPRLPSISGWDNTPLTRPLNPFLPAHTTFTGGGVNPYHPDPQDPSHIYPRYGYNDTVSGLDSFQDGVAWDYANLWDPLHGGWGQIDELNNNNWHPGEVAIIGKHLYQTISGYQVYCVHADGSPEDTTSRLVRMYYRDPNLSEAGVRRLNLAGGGYFDANGYPDKPWNNEPPGMSNLAYCRKAEFTLWFNDYTTFFVDGTSPANGAYDIVLRPYYYNELAQTIQYGTTTRLRHVVTVSKPVTTDDGYGPQYNRDDLASPPGPNTSNIPPEGVVQDGVVQSNQFTFTVQAIDADDVDINGQWYTPPAGEAVYYKVYAYYSATYDGTDPNLVFNEDNVVQQRLETQAIRYVDTSTTPHRHYVQIPVTLLPNNQQGLPTNSPGKRIWFGVRCYESRTSAHPEYATPSDPDGTPNTQITSVVVQDQLPPYFVDRLKPGQSTAQFLALTQYPNGLNGPLSLDQFYLDTSMVPYGDGIEIGFNPAVDPPYYDLSRPVTYDLYICSTPFTDINDPNKHPLHVTALTKTLTYTDYYDPTTNTPVDPLGDGPKLARQAYEFKLGIDPSGAPIIPGKSFYCAVVASDAASPPNQSLKFASEPVWSTRALPGGELLVDNFTDSDSVQVVGALAIDRARPVGLSFTSDVHVLYPVAAASGQDCNDLNYERWPGGVRNLSLRDQRIVQTSDPLSFQPNPPPPPPAPPVPQDLPFGLHGRSSLDFKLARSGGTGTDTILARDINGVPTPVMTYSGVQGSVVLAPWQLETGIRSGAAPTPWQITEHRYPVSAGGVGGTDGPAIASYMYYRVPGPNPNDPNTPYIWQNQDYVLSWEQESQGYLAWASPKQTNPQGAWLRQVRNPDSTLTPGFWPVGQVPGEPFATFANTGFFGYSMSPRGTDVILRQLGRRIEQGPPMVGPTAGQAGDPYGNVIFALGSSPHYNWFGGSNSQWNRVLLSWSTAPEQTWLPAQPVNLIAQLQALNFTTPPLETIGANGLEAVRTGPTSDACNIYVAFFNALQNEGKDDGHGLRIAAAALADKGQVLTNWSIPSNAATMIDPKASLATIVEDGLSPAGTVNQVDLRRKPSTSGGASRFVGLGCAYISRGIDLYLSESGGDSAAWTKVSPAYSAQYDDHPIDEGAIYWVRFDYLDDGRPYVLYAINKGLFNPDYQIRMWHP
jgi:hypothetical protein